MGDGGGGLGDGGSEGDCGMHTPQNTAHMVCMALSLHANICPISLSALQFGTTSTHGGGGDTGGVGGEGGGKGVSGAGGGGEGGGKGVSGAGGGGEGDGGGGGSTPELDDGGGGVAARSADHCSASTLLRTQEAKRHLRTRVPLNLGSATFLWLVRLLA